MKRCGLGLEFDFVLRLGLWLLTRAMRWYYRSVLFLQNRLSTLSNNTGVELSVIITVVMTVSP